jgi:hypothetical protein
MLTPCSTEFSKKRVLETKDENILGINGIECSKFKKLKLDDEGKAKEQKENTSCMILLS